LPDRHDEFFVGYLPTPTQLARFLRAAVVALALVAAGAAVVIAFGQRDPGDGTWELNDPHVIVGTVCASPVPVLLTRGASGSVASKLLVSEGKIGAGGRVAGFDGKVVKLHGTDIARLGLSIFEIADAGDAIAATDATTDAAPAISLPQKLIEPAPTTLTGEIIDPKCHAGAMKPGDGKAHKACATLCIRGGIPPMFLDESGKRYVLLDSKGSALTGGSLDAILPFVADHVQIDAAVVQRQGELMFLRIDPARLRRLTP
jgi:hypothetical protein